METKLKKALKRWLQEENPLPFTAIEWDHYDASVEIVFLQVEGDWTLKERKILQDFLKIYDKRILVGRMIRRGKWPPQENE